MKTKIGGHFGPLGPLGTLGLATVTQGTSGDEPETEVPPQPATSAETRHGNSQGVRLEPTDKAGGQSDPATKTNRAPTRATTAHDASQGNSGAPPTDAFPRGVRHDPGGGTYLT